MKMILISILVAIIAFVGFGLYKASALQKLQIIKSVNINGTAQDVFDMVRFLKNFPKWSPFLAQDPAQKYEVKGNDGLPGAQYHWNGNKGKDVGYQEIVKVDSLNYVRLQCDIQKPFVAKPSFEYYFTQTSSGIEVKQDFQLESSLSDAFFMWLFGAKASMEKTNQDGLNLLKKAVETKA